MYRKVVILKRHTFRANGENARRTEHGKEVAETKRGDGGDKNEYWMKKNTVWDDDA